MKRLLAAGALVTALTVGAPFGIALAATGAPPSPGPGGTCQATGHGAQLAASAALAAGFPAEQVITAVAIAGAESGYDPAATHLNSDGSTDYGLWQINSIHAVLLTQGDWRDPAANARMALAVWQAAGGSWSPWSTFTSGAWTAHLAEAAAAVSGAPAPTCPPAGAGTVAPDAAHAAVVALARTFLGLPYLWGGDTPAGFDCSGLTSYVYSNAAGVPIPRTAAQQQAAATPTSTPAPGDLVFFGSPASHVGIVLDPIAGTMIDAPHSGAVIREETYTSWPDQSGFGTLLPSR